MTQQTLMNALAGRALEALMSQVAGAISAVVSTVDGFAVASRAESEVQGSKLAAMASSISAICSVVGEESQVGAHQSIVIESENGYVVLVNINSASNPMILNVVANKTAVLGQLIYFAKQTAQELSEVAT